MVIILEAADEIGFNLHFYFNFVVIFQTMAVTMRKKYGYRLNNMFEKKGYRKLQKMKVYFKENTAKYDSVNFKNMLSCSISMYVSQLI